MKKVTKLLGLLLVFSMLLTTSVFAKSENAKESFVALGDSIPFGYNLGITNNTPPKTAFPYLLGEDAELRVRNLAVPGWKTADLLNALKTDQKSREAVRHADYITLNIGNNDLLQALYAAEFETRSNPTLFIPTLQSKIAQLNLEGNITAIVSEIRSLTDAPIVLYNVYNPFQTNEELHFLGKLVLPGLNSQLAALAFQLNVVIADAYSAFGTDQATYVIVGDIHPTVAGQEKLAEIGLKALGL